MFCFMGLIYSHNKNNCNNFNKFKLSGGGLYDENGVKLGKWIELSDGFSINSKIISNGEYKNDKKVGRWDI